MKTFLTFPSFALLILAGNLPAQKASDYTGLWELGGKQRRYAAALILRQDGNRYPNFFSGERKSCLLYTSPSPRDKRQARMPSSA